MSLYLPVVDALAKHCWVCGKTLPNSQYNIKEKRYSWTPANHRISWWVGRHGHNVLQDQNANGPNGLSLKPLAICPYLSNQAGTQPDPMPCTGWNLKKKQGWRRHLGSCAYLGNSLFQDVQFLSHYQPSKNAYLFCITFSSILFCYLQFFCCSLPDCFDILNLTLCLLHCVVLGFVFLRVLLNVKCTIFILNTNHPDDPLREIQIFQTLKKIIHSSTSFSYWHCPNFSQNKWVSSMRANEVWACLLCWFSSRAEYIYL